MDRGSHCLPLSIPPQQMAEEIYYYTAPSCIKCNGCGNATAGSLLDITLDTDLIPALPTSVRGIIQTVSDLIYSIQYDTDDLLGAATELTDQIVTEVTCVSDLTLSKEYVDETYGDLPEEVEAASEAMQEAVTNAVDTIPFEPFNGYVEAVTGSAGVAASGVLTLSANTSTGRVVTIGGIEIKMWLTVFAGTPPPHLQNIIEFSGDVTVTHAETSVEIMRFVNGDSPSAGNVTFHNRTFDTDMLSVVETVLPSTDIELVFTANEDGVAGNDITTTTTISGAAWGAATLEGGIDEVIEVTESGSDANTSRILYNYFDQELVTPSSTGNVFVDVEDLVSKLTMPAAPPEGRSFRLEARVSVTTDEAVNDKDSSAVFLLTGQVGNGGTVTVLHRQEADLDTVTGTRVGQGLRVGFDNNGLHNKRMFVQTELVAFNHI